MTNDNNVAPESFTRWLLSVAIGLVLVSVLILILFFAIYLSTPLLG